MNIQRVFLRFSAFLFIIFGGLESTAQNSSCTTLTEVAGSPFLVGSAPSAVAFSPFLTQGSSAGSTLLAVSNRFSGTITVYTVAPNGTFSSAATYNAGPFPGEIAFSQPLTTGPNMGGFLLAISNLVGVLVYTISPAGNFTQPPTFYGTVTSGEGFVAFSPALTQADGSFYLAIGSIGVDGQVTIYSIDPTGTNFTLLSPSPSAGTGPVGVAFSPYLAQGTSAGSFLFAIANYYSNTITVYSIDPTGKFSSPDTLSGSVLGPGSMAFSPVLTNNNFLLSIVNTLGTGITVYPVSSSGIFSSPVSYTTGSTITESIIQSVAFSPFSSNGSLLTAVTNYENSMVLVYNVNTSTGIFTPVCGSPFFADISAPAGVAFSPVLSDGNSLLAIANNGANNVAVYGSVPCPTVSIAINCNKKIKPSDTITYTISVTNTGSTTASQITVTSLLPACVTFAGAQAQGWTIAAVGQTITATLPALAVGETGSFIISGQASCTRCKPITFIATVSALCATPTTVSCTSCVC